MPQLKTTDKEHPYELDVKTKLLESRSLFGNLGKSTVISEKSIPDFSVIADLLVFSENYGIIGIEIKTEHDSTQRLNKQLKAYEAISTEVWVVVHDSLYAHAHRVLENNNHPHVGIISYSVFEGDIIFGKMREPTTSPNFRVEYILNLLTKRELLMLARRVASGSRGDVDAGVYGSMRDGHSSAITYRSSKHMLIQTIIHYMGRLGAYQVVVDPIVNHPYTPDKDNYSVATHVKKYHFANPDDKEEAEKLHIVNGNERTQAGWIPK